MDGKLLKAELWPPMRRLAIRNYVKTSDAILHGHRSGFFHFLNEAGQDTFLQGIC